MKTRNIHRILVIVSIISTYVLYLYNSLAAITLLVFVTFASVSALSFKRLRKNAFAAVKRTTQKLE